MRVVCDRILRATDGQAAPSSTWLTVGTEYLVLEIVAEAEGRVLLRLKSDSGEPGVYDVRMFRTTSGELPSKWTAAIASNGVLTFGPSEWQRQGFWEAYFDGDPTSINEFDHAFAAISAEDQLSRGQERQTGESA